MKNEREGIMILETKARFLYPDRGVSFRKQGRLIQNAFLVSGLVEIIARVLEEQSPPTEPERIKLSDGVQLLERLKRAEQYVNQETVNLIPQPEEEINVVSSIIDEGWHQLGSSIDNAATVIHHIVESEQLPDPLPVNSYRSALELFRTLHREIMDQLAEIHTDATDP